MRIRHHMQDDDTMVVTVSGEGAEPDLGRGIRRETQGDPERSVS
jgi:hypothetical protein